MLTVLVLLCVPVLLAVAFGVLVFLFYISRMVYSDLVETHGKSLKKWALIFSMPAILVVFFYLLNS